MKLLSVLVVACILVLPLQASIAKGKAAPGGAHGVKGYVKKNGTYVKPHRQTNPNPTQRDNWSSKPNVNPDNGKKGTKEAKK